MKKLMFIGLLSLFHCASHPQSDYFALPILEKLSELTLIEPPPDVVSFTPVYVIGVNDSIYESTFVKLSSVYQALYTKEYISYSKFLLEALNQRIKIDTKNPKTLFYFSTSFVVDSNMKLLYEKEKIYGIIERYCAVDGDLYSLSKAGLTLNEVNSISYYFFLNQYARVDDDYDATVNFKKIYSIID